MLYNKAIGATASAQKTYIEDVFSTYLYTGNGSTQTITNGIDLSGKGGLVWTKERSGPNSHLLYDTARGVGKYLISNNSDTQVTDATTLTSFNSTGFSLGVNTSYNGSDTSYASWTFRKAAKFFDVVAYTGNGVNGRAIPHNLESVPGCVIIKRLDSIADWFVWHRSATSGTGCLLNQSNSFTSSQDFVNSAPSATSFFVKNPSYDSGGTNANGASYVAYFFAHNAGGFGDTGNENVISCGSFSLSGGAAVVQLGWEPQWILTKRTNGGDNWRIFDISRGAYNRDFSLLLSANSSNSESQFVNLFPTPTGFQTEGDSTNFPTGSNYIYIAIRRPMKKPTTAVDVFDIALNTGTGGSGLLVRGSRPLDLLIYVDRSASSSFYSTTGHYIFNRITGPIRRLSTAQARSEDSVTTGNFQFDRSNAGYALEGVTNTSNYNASGKPYISYMFRRAPSFCDVLAYRGTSGASDGSSGRALSHNLGTAPELWMIKNRSNPDNWQVGFSVAGDSTSNVLSLNSSSENSPSSSAWLTPSSTEFGIGSSNLTLRPWNASGERYIAYLFASCQGISKVGSYTGSGTTKQIDCGFTNGARFVLIKRIDSIGDWYVWDTARGVVSADDPYLLLNSATAEITNTDYIDPLSSGFEISSSAPAAINASGGSYIFLAIA